ncbi:hypothetical protein CAMRE0001_2580 [Campylobacter rectus RM3267]|uniref:Uncharacterized protein n=1 Tax=Campylobacter rectus RM3267 TaxID=553218 RepID=B9D3W1_CAMRE|nr:hypothetical protein CAMRE0001_2580 [Campylobacter rectus RM3267]
MQKVLISKLEMLLIKVVFCRTIEEAKEKVGLFFGNMMKNF